MKEKLFEGVFEDLNEAKRELNNLKLMEETYCEFFQNQVKDMMKQKGFSDSGDIILSRPYGSFFHILFHLSEVEEARFKKDGNWSYLPSGIAEGDLELKKIKFLSLKNESPKTHPSYIKEEIIPFLYNTFQKLGFSIEMEKPEG